MAKKKAAAASSAARTESTPKVVRKSTRDDRGTSETVVNAKPSKSAAVAKASTAYKKLPGVSSGPTGPAESWRQSIAARSVAFENTIPAYLLDENFFFLDWNPAFDELFAKPLKLRRRTNHAGDFVAELVNPVAVLKRAASVFDKDPKPLVDLEQLQLLSKSYGRVDFRKVAAQVTDSDAQLMAWAVYLNIESCEKPELLWGDLQRRLESELHWSRYAVSYDKLLLNFPEYIRLLENVVSRVSGSRRILDLGAGTGNATLQLLQSGNDMEVCSVEPNHAMAQQLISKVEALENSTSTSYFSRLQLMKESILQLDEFPKLLRPGSYDAALMVNVLYAVDDPQKCMEKVGKLIRRGGKVVISTPHQQTDVDHLFDVLREALESQGLFDALRSNFDDARQRHEEMMSKIHRDTKSDIRSYIETAGFRITDWQDSVYADAVVVVEAEKL